MKENLISIITPMYNGEKYVRETIQSVLNQTYQEWEMIIVDDGSKDNSPSIVQEFCNKDSRIKLIKQKNRGSAAARNNSLRKAKGRYICFLDSDDIWDNNFLQDQLTFLKEQKAVIVFGSYRRIDENGNDTNKPFIVPDSVTYLDLLTTCSISCLTTIYDKKIVGEEFFKEELGSLRDDFAYWLSILRRIDKAVGNKNIMASYRVFSQSITGNKRKVIIPQFNVYYKVEKLGLIKSIYYTFRWALNSVIKYK